MEQKTATWQYSARQVIWMLSKKKLTTNKMKTNPAKLTTIIATQEQNTIKFAVSCAVEKYGTLQTSVYFQLNTNG